MANTSFKFDLIYWSCFLSRKVYLCHPLSLSTPSGLWLASLHAQSPSWLLTPFMAWSSLTFIKGLQHELLWVWLCPHTTMFGRFVYVVYTCSFSILTAALTYPLDCEWTLVSSPAFGSYNGAVINMLFHVFLWVHVYNFYWMFTWVEWPGPRVRCLASVAMTDSFQRERFKMYPL